VGDESGQLMSKDITAIGEALQLAADGPLFPDWEFQTLFGIEREDVRRVAAEWPNVDMKSENVACAVLGSLNLIEGYPHGCDRLIEEKLGTDWRYIHQLYARAAFAIEGRLPPDDFFGRLTRG
jgi:hypothetical protein